MNVDEAQKTLELNINFVYGKMKSDITISAESLALGAREIIGDMVDLAIKEIIYRELLRIMKEDLKVKL